MKYFVEKGNCLLTQKEYEAKLTHLSPMRRLLNKIIYNSNMKYTKSKIWHALKRGQVVCYLEYSNATPDEIKDIVARLNYLGYNVEFCYPLSCFSREVRVRLDDNEEGIGYVSY